MKLVSFTVLAVLVYTLSSAVAVVYGFTRPLMNWDVIGYTGSILSWQIADPELLYSATGELLRRDLPAWVYDQVWPGHALLPDARAFGQQLPFYQGKFLYLLGVQLASLTPLELVEATWWVSSLCMAGVFLLLYLMRPAVLAPLWFAGLLALCWLGPWPMASLARFSTPDAMALLFSMLAVYGWLCRRNWLLFGLAAVAATLTRGDSAVLVLLLATAAIMPQAGQYRLRIPQAVMIMAGVLATYVLTGWLAGSYGWERWFVYHFLEKTAYPADLLRELTLEEYLRAFRFNLDAALADHRLQLMALLSILASAAAWLKPPREPVWLLLLAALWLALLVRFLVFPAWLEYRYYHAFWVLILWVCLHLAASLAQRAMASLVNLKAQLAD